MESESCLCGMCCISTLIMQVDRSERMGTPTLLSWSLLVALEMWSYKRVSMCVEDYPPGLSWIHTPSKKRNYTVFLFSECWVSYICHNSFGGGGGYHCFAVTFVWQSFWVWQCLCLHVLCSFLHLGDFKNSSTTFSIILALSVNDTATPAMSTVGWNKIFRHYNNSFLPVHIICWLILFMFPTFYCHILSLCVCVCAGLFTCINFWEDLRISEGKFEYWCVCARQCWHWKARGIALLLTLPVFLWLSQNKPIVKSACKKSLHVFFPFECSSTSVVV